jgi:hypothetical protein
LVAFTAKGLILMSLRSKGCIERESNWKRLLRVTTFKGCKKNMGGACSTNEEEEECI